MASGKGCLKVAGFGCLGLIVLLLVVGGGTALMAKRAADRQVVEDVQAGSVPTADRLSPEGPISPAGPGRVVLDLADGEFHLDPAPAGQGVAVTASYDTTSYRLVEDLVALDDGRWEYRIGFRRTIPFLQALAMQILGDAHDPKVSITLPSDVELELDLSVAQGGFEAEIGGLWLKTADVHFDKGGFELNVSEPLRAPMERLAFEGSMGGFQASGLGNASPASLLVDVRMGGAEVDLTGDWRNDCDVRASSNMGGMAIFVPRELPVEGAHVQGKRLRPLEEPEVPLPVLRLDLSYERGEIEVHRR